MPMLGGAAVLGPALGKAGIGVGASLLGGLFSGGPSATERATTLANQRAMQAGQLINSNFSQTGSKMTELAGNSYSPVIDYWSKILSGNRGATTTALAPQLNQISDSYTAQRQAQAQLNPRGGGRATLLENLPYQQQRDQTTLMQTARPEAAQGLLQAGNAAGSTGNGLISNSIAALNASTSAGRSILDNEAQLRNYQLGVGKSIGASIFDLLKNMDFKIGKSGNGSGAVPPPVGPQPGDPSFYGPVQ